MSMWINLARVSKDAFAKIQADGSLCDALFFDDDDESKAKLKDLGIGEDDVAGFDYLMVHGALQAMAEATGEAIDEDTAVFDELGIEGELDYDAGYGPAFWIGEKGMETLSNGFVSEVDDEVSAIIGKAKDNGDIIVGVLS